MHCSTTQELDPSPDLVTKICGLMAELPVEPGRAKYWVEVREGRGNWLRL